MDKRDGNLTETDNRPDCRYGADCYQKNPAHHQKYKHPPKRSSEIESPTKKQKLNGEGNGTLQSESSNSPQSPGTSINKSSSNSADESKSNEVNVSDAKTNEEVGSEEKKVTLPKDVKERIKYLFLVDMPEDFYSFWELSKSLCKISPCDAFKDVKLQLVGPYDVLAGKIPDVIDKDPECFLRHWRYYYDPPEFQTVIRGNDNEQFHMGYFRDDPKENPVFIGSNCINKKKTDKNCEIKPLGANLFAAVNNYMDCLKESSSDPFTKMKIPPLQKALTTWALNKGYTLGKSSAQMQARQKKIVTRTFHECGIVVPVDKKNDIGYRELAVTDSSLKRILKGIVESKTEEERTQYWTQLQPVITFANIANDECDFGTSLELGIDLFCYGSPLLHRSAKQLMVTAYNLLGRHEFAKIIEAHLEDRRKGVNLSVL